MLKEFARDQKAIPYFSIHELGEKEYLNSAAYTLSQCTDFLRDPERFPNPEINKVAALTSKIIDNKEIPVVLDEWGLPLVVFAVLGEGFEQKPQFIIPTNFLQQVNKDPISQLGRIAYMASQGKDYYAKRDEKETPEIISQRARAYEAEVLITILRMGVVDLDSFQQQQQEILESNPEGLRSLSDGLFYPTPDYDN